ncbi:MAG: choice-of-anchor J domain-containing protein [Muribaculaceae bacterium]
MKKSHIVCGALAVVAVSATIISARTGIVRGTGADKAVSAIARPADGEALSQIRSAHSSATAATHVAQSPAIVIAEDVTPVYSLVPTQAEFESMLIVDPNPDDRATFEYNSTYPLLYWDRANSDSGNADVWIFTPAVQLPSGSNMYTVSIEASSTTNYTTESFEIAIGRERSVEGMTQIILTEPAICGKEFATCSSQFAVAEAGTYYIGIHATSANSSGWRLGLQNLKIGMSEASSLYPAAVTDLTATPDASGALKATVSFKLPTAYLTGATIESTATITARVSSSEETVSVTGAPGEAKTCSIKMPEGTATITVVTASADGDGGSAKVTARCGLDTPADVEPTWNVGDDGKTIAISWPAVTTGVNGGVVGGDIKYCVYSISLDSNTQQYIWTPLSGDISDTEYSCTVVSDTQSLYQFVVTAKNSAGESPGAYVYAMLGKPYALPMTETYASKTVTYQGLFIDYPTDEYQSSWALDDPSLLGDDVPATDGGALICVNTEAYVSYKGYLELPKFSPAGCDRVRVTLTTFIGGATAPTNVYLKGNGGLNVLLGTISASTPGNGWTDVSFDIPTEYLSRGWLNLAFDVSVNYFEQFFALDGYKIYQRVSEDLELSSLSTATSVHLGEASTIQAEVTNIGYATMSAPAVKAQILDGSTVIDEVEMTCGGDGASLNEGDHASYTAEFVIRKSEYAGRRLTAKAYICSSDGDDTNNSLTSSDIYVIASSDPIVTDLAAAVDADNAAVALSWSAPRTDIYEESFETYTHGDYPSQLGQWSNIDFDGRNGYVLEGYGIPDEYGPKAFQVLNTDALGLTDDLPAVTGSQFAAAFSAIQGQSDDWLISPQIKGGSQLSFYLTVISSLFKETVEVMYSSTDSDFDSFAVLDGGAIVTDDEGWTKYTFTLPADARYVAIHYASYDAFGIFIDDVVCSPADTDTTIDSYNVYRDGLLLASGVTETAYTDTAVDLSTEHSYNVAIVGTRAGASAEFPWSNTVIVGRTALSDIEATALQVSTRSGEIIVSNTGGADVTIYNVAGAIVARSCGDATFAVSSGIYIVRTATATAKVMVP